MACSHSKIFTRTVQGKTVIKCLGYPKSWLQGGKTEKLVSTPVESVLKSIQYYITEKDKSTAIRLGLKIGLLAEEVEKMYQEYHQNHSI